MRIGRREIEMPWELPPDLAAKGDLTPAELEAEARAERPLLKKAGFRDSAIFHPKMMKRQYLRVAGYLGWLGMKPYFVCAATITGGAVIMVIFFWMAVAAAYDPTQAAAQIPGWAGGVAGLIVGLISTIPGSTLMLAFSRFDTAYSPTRVVQAEYTDPDRKLGRRVVALEVVPLLRMATVTDQADRYIGPEGHDSFGRGRSLLETDRSITEVEDVREYYDAKPHRATFSGMFASATHALYFQVADASALKRRWERKRTEKKLTLDPVGNAGVLLLLVSLVFALIVSMSGVDVTQVTNNLPYGG